VHSIPDQAQHTTLSYAFCEATDGRWLTSQGSWREMDGGAPRLCRRNLLYAPRIPPSRNALAGTADGTAIGYQVSSSLIKDVTLLK